MAGDLVFRKMSGAGNDFLLVDNRGGAVAEPDKPALARRVCPRRVGVGADGLVLLEPSQTCDFRMRIFNPDGTEAEMCGNASRCVALYAIERGLAGAEMVFDTLAGPIRAVVADGQARVGLGEAARPVRHADLDFAGRTADVHFVDTGVPHAVVAVEAVESADVVGWGRALRNHARFAPAGTNADFIARDGETVRVRTYERGVEDETLACGTGVTAAALVAATVWDLPSPVGLVTQSGDRLEVAFRFEDDRAVALWLSGPAVTVYDATLPAAFLA